MRGPIRVLVVDDSMVCLAAVRRALEEVSGFAVVGEAHDGARAVTLTSELRPHVVVMDMRMPGMNGLDAVERIMSRAPTPILVLSGDPSAKNGQLTYEALRRGAIDMLAKDDLTICATSRARLRERVAFLSTVPVIRHLAPRVERYVAPSRVARPRSRGEVAVLVASTGGPAALARVLGDLPSSFALPMLIVQHLRPSFVHGLAGWLDGVSPLTVRVAEEGQPLEPGVALLAPDGAHLTLGPGRRIRLEPAASEGGYCPSGDALLTSVTRELRARAIGVVMTGMGDDGARGLQALRRAGGTTIVQDEPTSAVYGMPQAALRLEPSHVELPFDQIAPAIAAARRPAEVS